MVGGGTLMRDVFDYAAPLGPLGWIAEHLVLRNEVIRRAAESDGWKRFF